MRSQQDLQVKLRERLRRLMTATFVLAAHETRLAVDWITGQSELRALIDEVVRLEADLDSDLWFREVSTTRDGFYWDSTTESGRAILSWTFMSRVAEADRSSTQEGFDLVRALAIPMTRSSTVADAWLFIVEQVMTPLFDYLTEHIGDQASVLHVLERYVRRVEWFDREELYGKFASHTHNGEEIYNLDLQRFLYLHGDYITHAKARSASGEPDLIGGLDTDDPLVCDGKIFDADSRGKLYLAKGVNQVLQYAQDYSKNVAYLIVFNISGRTIQFPHEGKPDSWPPFMELSGVRIYLVSVRALPPAKTASKLGKAAPVAITRENLITPSDELDG